MLSFEKSQESKLFHFYVPQKRGKRNATVVQIPKYVTAPMFYKARNLCHMELQKSSEQ